MGNKNMFSSETDYDHSINNQMYEVYLEEYKRISAYNSQINNTFLLLQNLPLTGIIVAFGVLKDFSILSLILPFFICYNIYNTIKYTIEMFENAGYARCLEDIINTYLKKEVLIRESVLKLKLRNNIFTGGYLQVVFLVPVIASSIYFFIKEFMRIYSPGNVLNNTIMICLAASLIASLVALVYMGCKLIKAKEQTNSAIKNYMSANIFKIKK